MGKNVLPDFNDRVGSMRSHLKTHLEENHGGLASMYGEMTEEEKAAGKLIGKLVATGFGNKQVDDAFAWWIVEHNNGEELSWIKKNIALMEAVGTLASIGGEEGYRTLRKILVLLNQKA